MSLNGINTPNANPLLGTVGTTLRPDSRTRVGNGTQGGTQSPSHGITQGAPHGAPHGSSSIVTQPTLKSQAPIAGTSTSAVPAEAPSGTDPELWSVLTSDERAFFAKSAHMGPLTYGRIKSMTAPVAPAARGVRLDVRA